MTEMLETDVAQFQIAAAAARARLTTDPQRPQYHFTAPMNWLNDPNGLIQWQGVYHLFYQFNPYSPLSATKHWGHATSTDLVNWTDLPVALAPGPDAYDADGIYSGCAVDDDGTPIILYSGVQWPYQLVCRAVGDDRLLRWQKDVANPVVSSPPPGIDILTTDDGRVHYRDPSVWREADGTWGMVVGSGITNVGGTVFLYRSADLREWQYVGPLLVGDMNQHEPFWTGTMWECPQLFALDGKHVLLFSVWHERRTRYPAYFTGTFEDGSFTPEYAGIIDPGSHYAPQTFRDEQGRRVLIGWLREQREAEALAASDWNGAMTIPWILSLGEDGSLRFAPTPELITLRHHHRQVANVVVVDGETGPIDGIAGDCLEFAMTITDIAAKRFGLIVRRAPDGEEQTRIVCDSERRVIYVDRDRSSLQPQGEIIAHEAQLHLSPDGALRIQAFLDRSVLELVANDRTLLSERIYPSRPDSLGVAFFAEEGAMTVAAFDVWTMKPNEYAPAT